MNSKSELYFPSQEALDQATIKDYRDMYRQSVEDREGFWAEQAEHLEWYRKWDKVLDDSQAPFYKWFVGGKTNIIHNAIDRHVKSANRNKLALIWEGEPGDVKTLSYFALNREVSKFANILKSMGVKRGEIISLYMPQIPELVLAMLACAKIGAIHSVIYGGFSHEALADRINDAKSRVLITADGGFRRGKPVHLKKIANKAMMQSPTIEVCITVRRIGDKAFKKEKTSDGFQCPFHNQAPEEEPVHMENDRDYWYHDLLKLPVASPKCETEEMDAEDMLFLLYTSGSTGKPKGLVHTHGGYSVYTSTTHRMVFDIKPEDRFWCAADPGWITGHSYLVYSPLINGTTIMLYEGAPNHPYPNRWWQMIEKYGVSILYTSPTAIRGLMRYGDTWPSRHDLSSLRLLGSVGEPINPEVWKWYHKAIGNNQRPIMDTWWQTETGGFMITPLPASPLKPGSASKPFLGNECGVVDQNGEDLAPGEEGALVIKAPWPGMARTIFGDPERYIETYWKRFKHKGWYDAGDAARIDEDGYYWIIGRTDDVIKISGYRLGTAEIENAVVAHPSVSEAAAIGLPDDLKGNVIHVFAILNQNIDGDMRLEQELKQHVREFMGPIAIPEKIIFVEQLPKTRSGKIMRRVLKARTLGQDEGDLSTLEE